MKFWLWIWCCEITSRWHSEGDCRQRNQSSCPIDEARTTFHHRQNFWEQPKILMFHLTWFDIKHTASNSNWSASISLKPGEKNLKLSKGNPSCPQVALVDPLPLLFIQPCCSSIGHQILGRLLYLGKRAATRSPSATWFVSLIAFILLNKQVLQLQFQEHSNHQKGINIHSTRSQAMLFCAKDLDVHSILHSKQVLSTYMASLPREV